jgi:hypothetical protein
LFLQIPQDMEGQSMSGSLSSKKRRGELLLEDAMLFAPQRPYWIAQPHAEGHTCVTCGKRIPTPGLCDLCQVIFKLGMAYVAERMAGAAGDAAEQGVPELDGVEAEHS